jgi:hypothetical protein
MIMVISFEAISHVMVFDGLNLAYIIALSLLVNGGVFYTLQALVLSHFSYTIIR